MKASELMIGDWVHKLEKGGHYIPVQVTAIYGESENNVDYRKRDWQCGVSGVISLDGIEPLNITENILLDNGYERGTYAWRTFIKNLNDTQRLVINQFDRDDNVWLFKVVNPQDMSIENHILLYHVNQLQHAYKLLGIEEEIKL